MSVSIHSLGIDKLSTDEQLTLVRELWNHIATHRDSPQLSDADREELRRRVAEDDAQPDDVIAWEQVKQQARRRSGQ